jgi:hypothetical protein
VASVEAIGYAERANTVTRGNPTIADTLAWIQHLLGRDREAKGEDVKALQARLGKK